MNLKTAMGWAARILALTVIYVVLYLVASRVATAIVPMNLPPLPQDKMSGVFLGIFLTALVDTLVVTLLIVFSRWQGYKLMAGLWIALFGMMGVMSQIETWYFAPALGIERSIAVTVFLRDLIATIVFVPLAVLILGKMRGQPDDEPNDRLMFPIGQWVWKLAAIMVGYAILYFSFGFVVAWQNPALRTMYGGGVNQDVFSPANLVPFQLARGALWALFALLPIRFIRARPWPTAVLLGLLVALPMNIVLSIPNTLMPDPSVRLSHFIETASSNFLLGLLIFWLLHRRHTSLRDLFAGTDHKSESRTPSRAAGD